MIFIYKAMVHTRLSSHVIKCRQNLTRDGLQIAKFIEKNIKHFLLQIYNHIFNLLDAIKPPDASLNIPTNLQH